MDLDQDHDQAMDGIEVIATTEFPSLDPLTLDPSVLNLGSNIISEHDTSMSPVFERSIVRTSISKVPNGRGSVSRSPSYTQETGSRILSQAPKSEVLP